MTWYVSCPSVTLASASQAPCWGVSVRLAIRGCSARMAAGTWGGFEAIAARSVGVRSRSCRAVAWP